MLQIESDALTNAAHTETLTLPFDLRRKSRQRARLDSGLEAALRMPRGRVLRHGDLLRSTEGVVVMVQAADELVSTVTATDPLALARGAYHLGNRHVSLQVGEGWLRYQHDHVLDEMVRGLGLVVTSERAAFEPEPGAYHGHGSHGHSHE